MGRKRRSPSSNRGRQEWWAKHLNRETIIKRAVVDEIRRQKAEDEFRKNKERDKPCYD